MSPGGYTPIAEPGIVGALHSAALVGTHRTTDWYYPERFDGTSLLAALLDDRPRIASTDTHTVTRQLHLPDTTQLALISVAVDLDRGLQLSPMPAA